MNNTEIVPPPFARERMGAILSAHTGILLGSFHEMQKYADEVMETTTTTTTFASEEFSTKLKEKSKSDCEKVIRWLGFGDGN